MPKSKTAHYNREDIVDYIEEIGIEYGIKFNIPNLDKTLSEASGTLGDTEYSERLDLFILMLALIQAKEVISKINYNLSAKGRILQPKINIPEKVKLVYSGKNITIRGYDFKHDKPETNLYIHTKYYKKEFGDIKFVYEDLKDLTKGNGYFLDDGSSKVRAVISPNIRLNKTDINQSGYDIWSYIISLILPLLNRRDKMVEALWSDYGDEVENIQINGDDISKNITSIKLSDAMLNYLTGEIVKDFM